MLFMPSVAKKAYYAECRYAECRGARPFRDRLMFEFKNFVHSIDKSQQVITHNVNFEIKHSYQVSNVYKTFLSLPGLGNEPGVF
jgi:hypothetical protein